MSTSLMSMWMMFFVSVLVTQSVLLPVAAQARGQSTSPSASVKTVKLGYITVRYKA